MSDKAQMVLVGIHGDDLLDGYERLKKERDDALTRIAELEGARADLQERNRKASDTIVAANDRIKELERKSVQLSEPRRCWHLQGTPEGTRICYLHDGFVRVMGMPEDGDDHNCDEMGCGSLGDHVLMCFPLPTLDRVPAQAEPQVEGPYDGLTSTATPCHSCATKLPPEWCVRGGEGDREFSLVCCMCGRATGWTKDWRGLKDWWCMNNPALPDGTKHRPADREGGERT